MRTRSRAGADFFFTVWTLNQRHDTDGARIAPPPYNCFLRITPLVFLQKISVNSGIFPVCLVRYMPRRDDIHSVLIIGTGPIIIGQACEFDYSGTQACKALREEGLAARRAMRG